MKLPWAFVLCFVTLSPLSLQAQLGLYGGFTALNLGVPGNSGFVLYGGTAGAYLASGQLAILNLGLDLRASSTRSGGTSLTSGAIGAPGRSKPAHCAASPLRRGDGWHSQPELQRRFTEQRYPIRIPGSGGCRLHLFSPYRLAHLRIQLRGILCSKQ